MTSGINAIGHLVNVIVFTAVIAALLPQVRAAIPYWESLLDGVVIAGAVAHVFAWRAARKKGER
ncbi:MAG: hypothetical protein B7Z66_12185 [Chromatiales bacterium 21-64-14]|nr:MAG: hypothetical protein B7Z66_12185 [Chromatiales bacterium 21-64-14]HQU15475.1 hypothetical protein [Gammaproteobacteria bacterium]